MNATCAVAEAAAIGDTREYAAIRGGYKRGARGGRPPGSALVADVLRDADLVLAAQLVAQPQEVPPAVAPRQRAAALGPRARDRLPVRREPALIDRLAGHG